jgi:hypothetical protein
MSMPLKFARANKSEVSLVDLLDLDDVFAGASTTWARE